MSTVNLFVALDRGLAVSSDEGHSWRVELADEHLSCLAADPFEVGRLWCGGRGGDVWSSADSGTSWQPAAGTFGEVTAIAVSSTERGVLYLGTEPSALFRSADGGRTWVEQEALRALPSAPTWSFPPRPETSHVRWITPDPEREGVLSVCIEAGALVRSADGGRTWRDRTARGPLDTHTLRAHPAAPARLYSAAGDGFMHAGRGIPTGGYNRSDDRGETWTTPESGLTGVYLWSLAVDRSDPDRLVASGAGSPREAHDPGAARSAIYYSANGGAWQEAGPGLPASSGTTVASLVASPLVGGTFYAASNRGVFRSTDGGAGWAPLLDGWPEAWRTGRVEAFLATAA